MQVEYRDADVPLTKLGERQSEALGRELARQNVSGLPVTFWTSPYVGARRTISIALGAADVRSPNEHVDERLRDNEMGILEQLTPAGFENLRPTEYARRLRLGPYYHRPPGGESFTDVLLRFRSVMTDVDRVEDQNG